MTYYIAMMNDGEMTKLASYATYSEADMEHESWCDKYPYAWIEIVSKADYNQVTKED